MTLLLLFVVARSKLYLRLFVGGLNLMFLFLFFLRVGLYFRDLVFCIKSNLFFYDFDRCRYGDCGLSVDSFLRA